MKTIRKLIIPSGYVFELKLLRHNNAIISKCSKVRLYSKVLDEEKAVYAYNILSNLLKSNYEGHFNTMSLPDDQLEYLRQNLTDKINGTDILSFKLLLIRGEVEVVEP